MKKQLSFTLFASLLFILNVFNLNAQENKLNIGLIGGPNLTVVRNPLLLFSPTFKFFTGINIEYNISEKTFLKCNLLFDRKGANINIKNASSPTSNIYIFKVHNNFNYLGLPVLIGRKLGKKDYFYGNIGTYISYLLRQDIENKEYSYDFTESFDKLDIAIAGGLGINLPIKDLLLINVEARYNLGIRNFNRQYPNFYYSMHSTNLILGLSYKLSRKANSNI